MLFVSIVYAQNTLYIHRQYVFDFRYKYNDVIIIKQVFTMKFYTRHSIP